MELGTKQQLWLNALRSGEFKQGKHYLYNKGKYCCLGVANRVLQLREKDVFDLKTTYSHIGLYFDSMKLLTDLNDEGYSFNQIADYIEQNREYFFTHSV